MAATGAVDADDTDDEDEDDDEDEPETARAGTLPRFAFDAATLVDDATGDYTVSKSSKKSRSKSSLLEGCVALRAADDTDDDVDDTDTDEPDR